MEAATTFETLRVLHNLWRSKQVTVTKVKQILKETYDLELTSITNRKIKAESLDGKSKYSIK